MRALRLIGLAVVGTFAWKFMQRRRAVHPFYTPTYEAPYVMEQQPSKKNPLRTDAAAALKDTVGAGSTVVHVVVGRAGSTVRWLRSMRGAGVPADGMAATLADIDDGSVEFEWLVRTSEPEAVRGALEAAGISFGAADPAVHDREDVVVERLQAAGVHLDQEASSSVAQTATARYVGTTSPRRLANAFEQTLKQAHTGFIVDISAGAPALIDEHPTVGTGVLALLEPGEARLTHGDSGRAFLRAMRAAGERQERAR